MLFQHSHACVSRISLVTVFLLAASLFVGGVTVHAASMFWSLPDEPEGYGYYASLDKDVYAPGEAATAFATCATPYLPGCSVMMFDPSESITNGQTIEYFPPNMVMLSCSTYTNFEWCSNTFNVPNTPGVYTAQLFGWRFAFFLDSIPASLDYIVECPVGSSWDGGSCVAASLPDLTAGSTIVTPSSGTVGQVMNFSSTMTNIGAGIGYTIPSIFQVYNYTSSSNYTLSGGGYTNLVPSEVIALGNSDTFGTAGTYAVRSCANYDTGWGGSITESDSGNNCGAWQNFTIACGNGANNPPTCSQCPAGSAYVTGSCVACTGGCTGTGGNTGDSDGGLVCSNGASNPHLCSVFPPTATLSANPTVIDKGQSAILSWNSTNATSCTGTGFTAGGTSGTRSTGTLATSTTINYQVVCSGAGGSSAPAFASVEVLSPDVSITASPSRVQTGGSSLIAWSANGVNSCVVTGPSGGIASGDADSVTHVFPSGSQSFSITAQSIFTITCETNDDPISESVTANVTPSFQEF